MPCWHDHDSGSSPRSLHQPTLADFEGWTVESKIKNKARDVVYHTKEADHDLDVLQVQLVTLFGYLEAEGT
eukprot:12574631-Prorocentrum_lima.AAC.1